MEFGGLYGGHGAGGGGGGMGGGGGGMSLWPGAMQSSLWHIPGDYSSLAAAKYLTPSARRESGSGTEGGGGGVVDGAGGGGALGVPVSSLAFDALEERLWLTDSSGYLRSYMLPDLSLFSSSRVVWNGRAGEDDARWSVVDDLCGLSVHTSFTYVT